MIDIIIFILTIVFSIIDYFLLQIIAVVLVLLLAASSHLLTTYFYKLAPVRWHRSMHKPLVIVGGIGGVISGLKLAFVVMVSVYWLFFYASISGRNSPCFAHLGAPPINTAACEKAIEESIKPPLERWLITPPWVRQNCEAIAPNSFELVSYCKALRTVPLWDAWPQYITLILTGLGSGLACAVIVNKAYKGSMG